MKSSITVIFLVTTIANQGCFAGFDACPVGDSKQRHGTAPHNFHCASGDVLMIAADDNFYCCDEASLAPCSHTGMVSRFVREYGPYNDYGYIYITTNKEAQRPGNLYAYEVTKGNKKYLCPYPIGFLWRNIYNPYNSPIQPPVPPDTYLPTDHKDIKSKLKSCDGHKDCAVDEFCGDAINYSIDIKHQGLCYQNSARICTENDECSGSYCAHREINLPHIDDKKQFCYKSPNITGDNADKMQYALQSSNKNFNFCHNDGGCSSVDDPSGVCHLDLLPTDPTNSNNLKWADYVPNSNPALLGKEKLYPGICVEAKPIAFILSKVYDTLSVDDKKGEIGKKYLPTDYEDGRGRRDLLKKCDNNADCLKGEFCGNIISLTETDNFDTKHKFCFVVPESGSTPYAVIPKIASLIPCNSDEDCKVGGAEGNLLCNTGRLQYPKMEDGKMQLFVGLCVEEEQSSTMIIIIIVVVVLLVIILVALIGGFVFYKLKMKKGKNGKKGKNDKSELTNKKTKKDKKGKKDKKKNKKGNKTSKSTASTTKSTSMTGQSGMGTTTGGYSPAIY